MSTSTPINLHSATDLGAIFKTLQPAGVVALSGYDLTTADLTVPGCEKVLRLTNEAIDGPGVGWTVCAMGPSKWAPPPLLDRVQGYMVESEETFKRAIAHCFGSTQPEIAKDARAFV